MTLIYKPSFIKKVKVRRKKYIRRIKKVKARIKKYIRRIIINSISKSYKITKYFIPVDKNTMIFIAYHGRGYNCNPKYIHQELIKDERFKDFNFIWAVKKPKEEQIENAICVKYRGIKYFYYLAKSKFWISNCKLPKYVSKKNNQIYINTWHGTPLKRLAHDIEIPEGSTFYRSRMSKEDMRRSYDHDTKQYNYLVSPNNFTSEKYKSCFKVPDSIIKECGYPRNDFLVNLTQQKIDQLKDTLGIPKDKHVILYAPTWRDNQFTHSGYTFELKCDFKKWQHYLGEDYVVIFKPHYLISNKFNLNNFEDFVFTIPPATDINHLYAVSDILITDYSSVFFDYSILNRPILFYMYDLEEYQYNLRGFYLDIHKDLPGPIVTHEEDLFKIIINKLYEFDKEKREEFIKKFHSSENGAAAKYVVDNLIYPHTKLKY